MPTKHSIPFREKLHAIGLIDAAKQSIRKVSLVVGVAKSTLHDNLANYRREIAAFELGQQQSQRALAKDILLVSFEGKTSSRDCARILSKQRDKKLSHQNVLSVLSQAGEIARKKNHEMIPLSALKKDQNALFAPLSALKCGAFDEIFQKKLPILGFADPVSAYVFLEPASDRKSESWSHFLAKLRAMGLDPDSVVTDGGQGMLKAISKIFPTAVRVRDLFHVLQKLSKALRVLEGNCYRLITNHDKSEKEADKPGELEKLRSRMDKAILIFDELSQLIDDLRRSCYFENDSGYVSASKIKGIIGRIIGLIDEAGQLRIRHRALKEARSYLKEGGKDIVAYKETIERLIQAHFGETHLDTVLGYICPIIEFLDQIQRSYENERRRKFWEKKLVHARGSFRALSFIDQEEVDNAIDEIAKTMSLIKKSNSLIEAVNSVVRRFLVTYKSIPSWFCPLFTFYWNHRRFDRGKRKGLKPKEVLMGQHIEGDWIDALLADHCFDDEKSTSTPARRLATEAA